MKATFVSFLLMVAISVSGANSATLSEKGLERHYMDTLTNIVFQLNDAGVFADWLESFKKSDNYNPSTMSKALVSIAERGVASTDAEIIRMANTSINAMEYLLLTNTLPKLEEWTLRDSQLAISAFSAYGEITGHDDRYIELGKNAIESKTLMQNFVLGRMTMLLYPLEPDAMAQFGLHCQPLQGKARLKITRIVINREDWNFESCVDTEEMLSRTLAGYTNSLEHLRSQRRINEFLLQEKDFISKQSYHRIIGDNKKLSDEEWYRRATNACQSEIARVMALPENERLNMTAILDAKIAAIEAAEARIACRELWKRRLRIGALVLPIPVIAIAVIFARRRMKR